MSVLSFTTMLVSFCGGMLLGARLWWQAALMWALAAAMLALQFAGS